MPNLQLHVLTCLVMSQVVGTVGPLTAACSGTGYLKLVALQPVQESSNELM